MVDQVTNVGPGLGFGSRQGCTKGVQRQFMIPKVGLTAADDGSKCPRHKVTCLQCSFGRK